MGAVVQIEGFGPATQARVAKALAGGGATSASPGGTEDEASREGANLEARLQEEVSAKGQTLLGNVFASNLPLVWRDLAAQMRDGEGGDDDSKMIVRLNLVIRRYTDAPAATLMASVSWERRKKHTDASEIVEIDLAQPRLPGIDGDSQDKAQDCTAEQDLCSCGHSRKDHRTADKRCRVCRCGEFSVVYPIGSEGLMSTAEPPHAAAEAGESQQGGKKRTRARRD